MSLKPWYQVVKLHADIRDGNFTQDQFAARLHDVLIKDKNSEYTNPRLFFDRTHITSGLESLLKEVIDRIEGTGNTPPVLQILTPFGGGKTHALLALYHVISNGKELEDHHSLGCLRLRRGKNTLPEAPVAVIDGNQLGSDVFRYPDGTQVRTLWGHIAFQLIGRKGYEIIAENDRSLRCPSGETIDRLLSLSGKGLILLDEIVNYMESAATVEVLDSTLLFQTRTFLQILTQNAGKHPNFVIAATLPKSHLEVHGEASKGELERMKKIFSRVQNLREPVEGEEIYEIIKRRLFADTGKTSIHQDIANSYMMDYKNRTNLPEEVKKTDYHEKFVKAYPFHPFLIDIFLRHVATNPGFQKTRGALRLLGLVVSDLWKKKRADFMIHAGDVDLNNNEIKNELVELIDPEYRNVLEADLTGKGANALMVDKENGGDHEISAVAQGLATVAFLYTLEKGSNSVGASENELHLGLARPGLSKSVIFDSMRTIEDKLHFISVDGGRYKFTVKPNLTRIIFDEKTRGVTEDDINQRLEKEIDNRIGRTPFDTRQWVESHMDIPDTPQPKLILLPMKYPWGEKGDFKDSEKFTMDIADHAGQGRRIFRNTLIFLFADHKEISLISETVRELLAVERINIKKDKYNLSKQQIQQLEDMYSKAKQGIFRSILNTYRYTGWIGPEGNRICVESRGRETVKEGQNISDYVLSFLKQHNKYIEGLTPILLTKFDKFKIWPPEEKTLHLKDLPGYFNQYTHLPILSDDRVLCEAISEGVSNGYFGYAKGMDVLNLELLKYKEKMSSDEVRLEEGYYIIRNDFAEELIKEEEEEKKVPRVNEGKGKYNVTDESDEQKEEQIDPEPAVSSGSITIRKPHIDDFRKVWINCEVPYDEFFNFFNGVIKPLGSNSDKIRLKINIEAEKSDGFNSTMIEDTVKETLYNIFNSTDAFQGE